MLLLFEKNGGGFLGMGIEKSLTYMSEISNRVVNKKNAT
jgi:hypothetical protein